MKTTEKPVKQGERAIWLATFLFATSVLFMGFHKDWAFWAAGGFGIIVSLLGYFLKWRP